MSRFEGTVCRKFIRPFSFPAPVSTSPPFQFPFTFVPRTGIEWARYLKKNENDAELRIYREVGEELDCHTRHAKRDIKKSELYWTKRTGILS